MNLTLHEIGRVVQARNDYDKYPDLKINKLEFDSRKIGPSDIFLPLRGEQDGHNFIAQAFLQGAAASFTERPLVDLAQPYLEVADSTAALQALAHYYLTKQKPDVIAITGSNGKTTTKDMTAAVLASHYPTYKTQGNYNNELGLPYTILAMPDDCQKLVLEMGMDRPGDIDFLSQLAQPKIALLTLVGESHLEFFGSRREIARGKMGITAGLKRDQVLVAPSDSIIDEFIPEGQKLVRFGGLGADLYISQLIEHRDRLSFQTNFMEKALSIPVPGKFNATNAMLAAYVGKLEGVPEEKIHLALSKVELTRNRTEWLKAKNGADILSDVYNANPTAMRLILESFQAMSARPGGRKIAVLADMLELGQESAALHAGLATTLGAKPLDQVFLYGPMMKHLAEQLPKANYFNDFQALNEALDDYLGPNDQVLIKGSNGMGLAKLVESLTK